MPAAGGLHHTWKLQTGWSSSRQPSWTTSSIQFITPHCSPSFGIAVPQAGCPSLWVVCSLSQSPLVSQRAANRSIKYLWSITIDLLPYNGPPQLPQITAHDITYVSIWIQCTTHFNYPGSLSSTCPGDFISWFTHQTRQSSCEASRCCRLWSINLHLPQKRYQLSLQQPKSWLGWWDYLGTFLYFLLAPLGFLTF